MAGLFDSTGRLITARDLAGAELFGLEFRRSVLERCGRVAALERIAMLAVALDLSVLTDTRDGVARDLVATLGADLRGGLRPLMARGMWLLSSASLYVLLKETIEFAPADGDDLAPDDLVRCLLGIGHDLDAVLGVDEQEFPKLSPDEQREVQDKLTVFEVAMLSFMRDDPLEVVVAQSQYFWREPWPATEPHRTKNLGASPAAMFTDVMGVDYDEFLRAGWAIWDHGGKVGPVLDPVELQRHYRLSDEVMALVRTQCTIGLDDLQAELRVQRENFEASALLRFNLQRRPVIVLPDGKWLVPRAQFTVQRFFGDIPSWDVKETLELTDPARAERFRQGMAFVFEQRVGDVLGRIASATNHAVVVTEVAMKAKWKSKKVTPKVCDWALASGANWLLFEVNNRRLVQRLAEGTGSFDDLNNEITNYLTETKFNQLFSTVDLFLQQGWTAMAARTTPASVFTPLVVVPDSGLHTSFLLEHSIKELVRDRVTRYPGIRVMPPTVITWRDLCVLEGLAEHGKDIADAVREWRFTVGRGVPMTLQDFLWKRWAERPRSTFDLDTGKKLLDTFATELGPPTEA